MIRLARLADLSKIEALYMSCRQALRAQGLAHQWYDFYPPTSLIRKDLEAQNLYILLHSATLAGVIALDEQQPEGYAQIDWQYQPHKVLVVHRLAILPEFWGMGYAKKLLAFAESFAETNDYSVIRLDAYSQNSALLKFYAQMGYQSTKEVLLLGQPWEYPFVCFEKKVK